MSRNTIVLIVVLTIVAGLLGWNYVAKPFSQLPLTSLDQDQTDAQPSSQSAPPSIAQQVDTVLALPLDLDSQTGMVSAETWQWLEQSQPAVITVFGEAVSQSQMVEVRRQLASRLLTAALAVDHEGGSVQRLNGEGFTPLPSWQSWCRVTASSSAALAQTSAQELKQAGISLVLAPVVDVGSSQPVLKSRVCSGDPLIVASKAAELAHAYQQAGLKPVFKHFPGIGETRRDLHQNFDRVTVTGDDAVLYQWLLQEFPTAGVMTTHVGVTNQYPDVPCSLSAACVGQLVNHYQQVLVISDALEMAAAGYQLPVASSSGQPATSAPAVPLAQRAMLALLAGNHLLLFGPSVTPTEMRAVRQEMISRAERDTLFAATLQQAARHTREWLEMKP